MQATEPRDELREIARAHLHDNHCYGDPGYCDPAKADWAFEVLEPAQLTNIFDSASRAREWLDDEIELDHADQLGRQWERLLYEEITEEVVIFVRDGLAYIWDGWHRCAAAIAKNVPLKAIVGRPKK
jgi:hypothetical protein